MSTFILVCIFTGFTPRGAQWQERAHYKLPIEFKRISNEMCTSLGGVVERK